MCLVSICFSLVCACLTHFQIWLLYRHSPTQTWKSKKEKKACRNCNNLQMTRFHVVSAKNPAQLIRCLSMPEVSHVSGMPCQLGMQPRQAPQKAHVEAGEPGSLGYLPPDALVPAPSPAECQGLCAHCLLCKHSWLPIPVLHLMECKAGARG